MISCLRVILLNRILALIAMTLFLAAPTRATEPQWSGEFAFGTIGNSASATAAIAWDDDHDGTPSIFIGGKFTTVGGVACNAIARWDGKQWTPLGSGITTSSGTLSIKAMTVFNDGSGEALYVGGIFNTAGGSAAVGVARWRSGAWQALGNGLGDPTFNLGVKCFAIYNGSLYAGGSFNTSGPLSVSGVAKWTGSAWAVVNNSLAQGVECLAVYDDQLGAGAKLYAGGSFSGRVRRLDGTTWTSLNVSGGSSPRVTQLAVYNPIAPAGKPLLYAAGRFTTAGATACANIASWDGANWADVAGGINVTSDFPSVSGMCVMKFPVAARGATQVGNELGERLIVGGSIDQAGGQASNQLPVFDGSKWIQLPNPGTFPQFLYFPPDGSPTGLLAGGITSDGLAQLGTQNWFPVNNGGINGFSPEIHRVCVGFEKTFLNGPERLILAQSGTAYQPETGLAQQTLVKIEWTFEHGVANALQLAPGLSGVGMDCVAVPDASHIDTIFAVGQFNTPCSGGSLLEIPPIGPPVCHGPLFGAGDPRVCVQIEPENEPSPLIHVGGNFLDASGFVDLDNGALYNPDTGEWLTNNPFFHPPNGPEFAAASGDIDGDGKSDFVAGGSFGLVDGQGTDNWYGVCTASRRPGAELLRSGGPHLVTGTGTAGFSSTPLAFKIGGLKPTSARSAAAAPGVPFALYAGGTFTNAGATVLNYIARYDGLNWQPLGTGMNGNVRALEIWDARDGKGPLLYAAGDFTTAGGVPASRIAKWDGQTWSPVNSDVLNGLNNRVNTLGVWDAGDGNGSSLVAGGTFTLAGGKSAGRLARLLGAPASCPADLNSDNQVDDADFSIFVVAYNTLDCADPAMPAGCPSDLTHDGIVEDADFVIFLAAYNALLCP